MPSSATHPDCAATAYLVAPQLTLLDVRGCPRACSPNAFEHVSRLAQLQHLRQVAEWESTSTAFPWLNTCPPSKLGRVPGSPSLS